MYYIDALLTSPLSGCLLCSFDLVCLVYLNICVCEAESSIWSLKANRSFDLSWRCPLGFSCDVSVQKPETVVVPEQIDLPENMCFCFPPVTHVFIFFLSSSGFWEHLLDFDRQSVSVEHLLFLLISQNAQIFICLCNVCVVV